MPLETLLQATLGELVGGNLLYVALFLLPLFAVIIQAYKGKLAENATTVMSVLGLVAITGVLTYILANLPVAGILFPIQAVFAVMLGTTTALALLSVFKTLGVKV